MKNAVCPWVARSLEVRSCQPFDFQCGRLAQLVRALLSHGRGHRFEFCIAHYVGLLRVCFGFFSAQRASFQIDLRHTWLRRYEAASMPCRTRRRLRWHWRQNGVGQVLLPSINGRSAANVCSRWSACSGSRSIVMLSTHLSGASTVVSIVLRSLVVTMTPLYRSPKFKLIRMCALSRRVVKKAPSAMHSLFPDPWPECEGSWTWTLDFQDPLNPTADSNPGHRSESK